MNDTVGRAAVRFACPGTCAVATGARSGSASASPWLRSAPAPSSPPATCPRADPPASARNFPCGLSATCEEALTKSASLGNLLGPLQVRKDLVALAAAAALCALLCAVLALAPSAGAASLEAKLTAARGEAVSISAALRESNAQLGAAESEAAAAEAREERLSGLLAEGEERAAELATGSPGPAAGLRPRGLACAAPALPWPSAWWRSTRAARRAPPASSSAPASYQELLTQDRLPGGDRRIRQRPRRPRRAGAKRRSPRGGAGRRPGGAQGRGLRRTPRRRGTRKSRRCAKPPRPRPPGWSRSSADRKPRCGTLKANIGSWVAEIGQEARAAKRAASEAEAEEEVGRWLGGPYSIPDLHRDVRVRRQLRRRQPLQRRRRRLPDPPLDLGTLRRPGRTAERAEGRTGPDRRRNLGGLGSERLGLRVGRGGPG